MNTTPLGLFITWTVYGTFLPGDARGWRHRSVGPQLAQPHLETWHRDRLGHDVILLEDSMQLVAEAAIYEICDVRPWSLWTTSARTNHVHVVITAPEYKPKVVRDQLKAKATMELRRTFAIWRDRPVWTGKGDIEFLHSESEIQQCVIYINEAQDRKHRDLM
ncbi:transposase [Novipirellula caenicola]|uniref:Transposase IS200-like domain-containing protein n=1 Tax=Novipirellula caenicola TaxID=1536901 RepID=A0ABP9VYP6_9BACT